MNKELSDLTFKLLQETPENIHSVGYGYKTKNGQLTNELSLIFGVNEKKPLSSIPTNEVLPKSFTFENGTIISTDVIQTPPISATACYVDADFIQPVQEHRKSRSEFIGGIRISIQDPVNPFFAYVGTLGCLCLDLTDNTIVALTNAHVASNVPRGAEQVLNSFNNKRTPLYQALPWNYNSTLKLKRYYPLRNFANTIDAAVLAITGTNNVNPLSSFRQLNLNYGNVTFATSAEINNSVFEKNPIFKAGSRTGPVGWPGSFPWGSELCSLTATQIAVSLNVFYEDITGPYIVPFSDCIAYQGTNTLASDGGDSGSVVCTLANQGNPILSAWKIIGLTFAGAGAGNNSISYACRIDNVANQLQLSSWDGQTTQLTKLSNESEFYVEGRSNLPFVDINGKRYWQVGMVNQA